MPFESPDWNLGDLLGDVRLGKVQLPDFQREWKWDTDRIVSLLATVTMGYPIGVLMTLETGGDGIRFKPKPLSGVPSPPKTAPEQLLLDGQQRMTSLFQSLASTAPVQTMDARGQKMVVWYYIDIARALDPALDREEAILTVPEDRVVREDFGRKIKADYSNRQQECAAGVFPLQLAFNSDATEDWMWDYTGNDAGRRDLWKAFKSQVLKQVTGYLVPVIKLTKGTPKEAVCTVFEKVNTGGVPLNVFELLTATFAGENWYFDEHHDDFRLNDDWVRIRERLAKHKVLKTLESTDLLQAVSLLATYKAAKAWKPQSGDDRNKAPGVSCKRRDILRLTLRDYLEWSPRVVEALEWAATFLAQQSIYRADDMPYRTQLVPLAAIRTMVGDKIDEYTIYGQIQRWYWCGVLGELYGGTTETRFARDLEQVLAWIDGKGPEPGTVMESSFHEQRLLTLRTRNSAAYKGIYALLMGAGCMDWMYHHELDMAAFFDYAIDIHHIFPKAWCETNAITRELRESIVNKTALSFRTNRTIGGRSPAAYLKTIEEKTRVAPARLDEIVFGHKIDPAPLREADFAGFFKDRKRRILDVIEGATGKAPVRATDAPGVDDPASFEAEDDDVEAEPDEALASSDVSPSTSSSGVL